MNARSSSMSSGTSWKNPQTTSTTLTSTILQPIANLSYLIRKGKTQLLRLCPPWWLKLLRRTPTRRYTRSMSCRLKLSTKRVSLLLKKQSMTSLSPSANRWIMTCKLLRDLSTQMSQSITRHRLQWVPRSKRGRMELAHTQLSSQLTEMLSSTTMSQILSRGLFKSFRKSRLLATRKELRISVDAQRIFLTIWCSQASASVTWCLLYLQNLKDWETLRELECIHSPLFQLMM